VNQVDRPFLDFSDVPQGSLAPSLAPPPIELRPKPLPPRDELTSPLQFGAYCLNPPNLPPPRPRFVPARQKIAAEPQRVVNAMANQYQVSPEELLGQRRSRGLAEARLAVYWLLRTLTDMSSTEIGNVLKKDHSTVLMGIKRCARFRLEDNAYRERIDAMAKEILEAAG